MRGNKLKYGLSLLSILIVGLTGIARAQLSGLIKIDGSSTVFPITEAVAEEFQKKQPKVRVIVGISGTGGGFKKLCNGETDISDASRPIKGSEVKLCRKNGAGYIELPVAYDGLAVMVNPKNDWVTSMTVKELKRLWEPKAQGRITRWSQVRPGWPNKGVQGEGPRPRFPGIISSGSIRIHFHSCFLTAQFAKYIRN